MSNCSKRLSFRIFADEKNISFTTDNLQNLKSVLNEELEIVFHEGAVVAQLSSARLSEREVSSSIFSDFNVYFDFPLLRVAIALNTRKTEH